MYYDDINTTASQLINVGLNNLFGEITWFYPTQSSEIVNRSVTYNYMQNHLHKDQYGLQDL